MAEEENEKHKKHHLHNLLHLHHKDKNDEKNNEEQTQDLPQFLGSTNSLAYLSAHAHPLVTIQGNALVSEAFTSMVLNGIHILPVVNSDQVLIGVLTKEDLRNAAQLPTIRYHEKSGLEELLQTLNSRPSFNVTVDKIMTTKNDTFFAYDTDDLRLIATLLKNNNVNGIPIIHKEMGVVLGVITRTDFLDIFLSRD